MPTGCYRFVTVLSFLSDFLNFFASHKPPPGSRGVGWACYSFAPCLRRRSAIAVWPPGTSDGAVAEGVGFAYSVLCFRSRLAMEGAVAAFE
jgi:hypothetical protein